MRGGELYRDPENKKIAGVCSGIGRFFGIETWLVRILTVTSFLLLGPPFVLVAYVAAWFILEEKSSSEMHSAGTFSSRGYTHKGFVNPGNDSQTAEAPQYAGKGYRNSSRYTGDNDDMGKVEVKARVWQAGLPPRQALLDIKHRYSKVESRLRRLERYITSKEFQLNRELNKL